MAKSGKNGTVRLSVGQAIVKFLSVQHSKQDQQQQRLIRGVFGIFGHGNVSGLAQGLYEYGQDLPYYQPCNEQSMVHTAAGFAKVQRRLATYACTASIGPGSTNMLTAAAAASVNRLPVLLLPSDIYATRHQGNVLQQLEHPLDAEVSFNDAFKPMSRFFDRINRAEQILTALPEAMRVLTDPAETGPVTISLPQDVQTFAYDYPASFFEPHVWRVARRPPEPEAIKEAAQLLAKAKKPVVISGGGVLYSNADKELLKFAEALGIPVGETTAGKGAMPGDSPLNIGAQGVQGIALCSQVMSEADVVVCVGTRLSDFTTASHSQFQNPDAKFISINVNAKDGFKMGSLPVLADAREGLKALQKAAQALGMKPNQAYLDSVAKKRQAWDKRIGDFLTTKFPKEKMNEGQLIKIVSDEAKPGDCAVGASSGLLSNLFKIWETTNNRKIHIEFGFSCMGYELPAALGARLSYPKGEVFAFVGDGTYLMNPMELVTAMQEKLKLTVLVSENHGYQCILAHQLHRAGRAFGNEFRCRDPKTNRLEGDYVKIDFAANARSLGAKAWNVRTEEELRQALREARKETVCCVIVVETEPQRSSPGSDLWWDVGVTEVSGDPVTRKLRKQYEDEREKFQKFYY